MINLEKLKPSAIVTVLVCLSSVISVEFLLFLLKRELFMSLDWLRLTVIGLGIASPLLIVNASFWGSSKVIRVESKTGKSFSHEESETLIWSISGAVTTLTISFLSFIGYTYKFSFYRAIWILFFVELAYTFIAMISGAVAEAAKTKKGQT